MFSIRIRPRIKRYTNCSVDQVLECFSQTLESHEFKLDSTLLKSHVMVKIPEEIHNYWSPELQLEVFENNLKDDVHTAHKETTIIRGFVGPKSTVWSMFMFFYIAFGLLTLFGTVLGSSQQTREIAVDGYWYTLLGGLGLVATFIVSQIGQRMGEEHTNILISFIEKTFVKCECSKD